VAPPLAVVLSKADLRQLVAHRPAPSAPAGLQYLLPATWTALQRANVTDLRRVSQLLSYAPAALANIQDRKGAIKAGEWT
jgi:dihydroorotase-like cyclic amidohydrolase